LKGVVFKNAEGDVEEFACDGAADGEIMEPSAFQNCNPRLKGAARGRRLIYRTGSTELAAKQFPTFLGQVLDLESSALSGDLKREKRPASLRQSPDGYESSLVSAHENAFATDPLLNFLCTYEIGL
jgi:hypothetical protein